MDDNYSLAGDLIVAITRLGKSHFWERRSLLDLETGWPREHLSRCTGCFAFNRYPFRFWRQAERRNDASESHRRRPRASLRMLDKPNPGDPKSRRRYNLVVWCSFRVVNLRRCWLRWPAGSRPCRSLPSNSASPPTRSTTILSRPPTFCAATAFDGPRFGTFGVRNTEQPLEKVRQARAIFDEQGIRISVLDSGFFKIPLPPDTAEGGRKLDEQWKLLDSAMERVRGFRNPQNPNFSLLCSKRGRSPLPILATESTNCCEKVARRARPGRFVLAVEDIGGGYVSNAAESAELLNRVKDDNIGLTCDPNNAAESATVSRRVPQARPSAYFSGHLRDYRHDSAGKAVWTAVGQGEFDNLGQIRALPKDGHKETFTSRPTGAIRRASWTPRRRLSKAF